MRMRPSRWFRRGIFEKHGGEGTSGQYGPQVQPEEAKILDKEDHVSRRRIKDAIRIHATKGGLD